MSSYKDHWSWPEAGSEERPRLIHSWKAHTEERQRWAHGDQRATAISAGTDAATNADIEAWRQLGSGRAAA